MSTLAEMSPCSFEQGKAEVKGITRRPRFVMKPNIRPGPVKSVGAAPKHKAQSSSSAASVADAAPSIAKSSHVGTDDTAHHSESWGMKSAAVVEERLKAPAHGVANIVELSGVSSSEKLQPVIHNEDSVERCSNVCTDTIKCKDQPYQAKPTESSHQVRPTDPSLPSDKGEKATEKLTKVESTASVGDLLPEQGNTRDGSEVDSRDTASEFDASVSECLSLDAEKERGADADEELKKNKRRRSKKQRTEPLPSREKSPDRQKMKMSDLLSWNPQQNFLPKKVKKKVNTTSSPEQTGNVDEDKEESNQSASLPAPQVMIGPDGSVVLNTESLLIQSVPDETKLPEAIEEDDDDRYLNTNSYRKHKKTKFWTEDENERFFLGLSMCGTDFSLMTNLLTNRSRRELKNKFHREERSRRPLIDKALAHRRAYDPAPFLEMVAAEEEKAKKLAKKKLKAKAEEKKEKKPAKSKTAKKRKKSCSENEEDEWGQELDEDDGDLVGKTEEKPQPTVTRRKRQMADKEAEARKEGQRADKAQPEVQESTRPSSHLSTEYTADKSPTRAALAPDTIQSIPGSSQVQIEMEGVNNPVQGVLIPKSMIPLIAPQLGIPETNTDYQVLLVQEQSSSGNLVHVYIIPDSEGKDNRTAGKALAPASSPAAVSGASCSSPYPLPGAPAPGLPFSLPNTWASTQLHQAGGQLLHQSPGQSQVFRTDSCDSGISPERQHSHAPQRTKPLWSSTSGVNVSAAHPALPEDSLLASTDSSVPHSCYSHILGIQTQSQRSNDSSVMCKMDLQPGGKNHADQKTKCLIVEVDECEGDRYTLTSL